MRYEGRHAPCGTVVADELPEGYPVDEGVGLYCPRCRVGFWSEPEPSAAERAPDPVEPPMAPPAPAPQPKRRTVWPAVGLIGAPAVAALVVVLALTGGSDEAPAPAPATTPRPTATVTVAATPEPPREVTRGPVTAELPPGWRVRRDGDRVILRGPDQQLVTVAPGPRKARPGRRRSGGREITTVRTDRRSWRITRYVDRGGVRVARSIRIG